MVFLCALRARVVFSEFTHLGIGFEFINVADKKDVAGEKDSDKFVPIPTSRCLSLSRPFVCLVFASFLFHPFVIYSVWLGTLKSTLHHFFWF